jgi:predicted transcriptional regulator
VKNPARQRLTPLETIIMEAVWDLSEATVRQVRDHLEPRKPMAYNTVLTMMRILRDKGFLASERDGRTDVYRPVVTREEAGRRSLRETLRNFFAGSPHELVSHLLELEDLSREEIQAIRRAVDRRLQKEPEREEESS